MNSPGRTIGFQTDSRPSYFGGGPWTNGKNAVDVNNDGHVSPWDAVTVINELNRSIARCLDQSEPQNEPILYYEVNADGHISPFDSLIVINIFKREPIGFHEVLRDSLLRQLCVC
jgi:hypothetical protein